ncbi:MAG: hypothetical protein WEC34_15795 [Acidimicrobiia bacterium]
MSPGEPTTVLEALNSFAAEGFGASFLLRDGALRCDACGAVHDIPRAEVVRVFRYEGPSDPDEEAVVYAMRCPICGAGGTLVSSYGPGADPELTDHLVMLDERFRPTP